MRTIGLAFLFLMASPSCFGQTYGLNDYPGTTTSTPTSGDICASLSAAVANLNQSPFTGGVIDARNMYTTGPVYTCASDPFDGHTRQVQIELGAAYVKLRQQILVPGNSTLSGTNPRGGTTAGTLLQADTSIFATLGWTYSLAQIKSGTTLTAEYTVPNSPYAFVPGNGTFVVVSGSSNSVYDGVCETTNTVVGGTSTTFDCVNNKAGLSGTSTSGTVRMPLVWLGGDGGSSASFGSRIEGLAVDCASIPDCIAVFSNTANEQSGISNVHFQNVTRYGVWYYADANAGSAQDWNDNDLDIILDSSTSDSTARVCYKLTGNSANTWGRVESGMTCRPNAASANIMVGAQIDGYVGGGIAGLHCELLNTCLDLGASATNKGLDFIGVTGGPNVGTLVNLENPTGGGSYSVRLSGLSVQGSTKIISDHMCGGAAGRTLPDSSLPVYIVGNGNATEPPQCFTESVNENPEFGGIDFRNTGTAEQARIRLATGSNDIVFSAASGNLYFRPGGDTVTTNQVEVNTAGQVVSTVITTPGSPPFVVASSTPVPNLTASNHPIYFLAGTQTPSVKVYTDKVTLSSGAATFTFGGSFTFSSTSYLCQATDTSSTAAAANATAASLTQVTVKGTGSDVIAISCSGT